MKKFKVMLLGLFSALMSSLCMNVMAAPMRLAGDESVVRDTIRLTWSAESGVKKTFYFGGTENGAFGVDWGDGRQDDWTISSTGDWFNLDAEVQHVYSEGGNYEVVLYGRDAMARITHFSTSYYKAFYNFSMPNGLTALDVKGSPDLEFLDCNYNELQQLDVSGNDRLVTLYCSGNRLMSLDLRNKSALLELDCSQNSLTALNLDGCTALGMLYCNENKLSVLDVSMGTELSELDCRLNELTALDMRSNMALEKLYCSKNRLRALNVGENDRLVLLHCDSNDLVELELNSLPALAIVNCNDNRLQKLDVKNCALMSELRCYNNRLQTLDLTGCGKLYFLYCQNNRLSELDVRTNLELRELYCSDNGLTDLKVDGLTALKHLDCHHNELHVLDLRSNAVIRYLDVHDNHLSLSELNNNSSKPIPELYKLLAYLVECNVEAGARYVLSPQTDSLDLEVDEVLDLSQEMHVADVVTDWEVLDRHGRVADSVYTVTDGTFQFHRSGVFYIMLKNTQITDFEDTEILEPVVFTWSVRVGEGDLWQRYTVTLMVNDTAMGKVSGGGQVLEDENVTVVAVPNAGYRFVRWEDATGQELATDSVLTFVVTQDTVLTAHFEKMVANEGVDALSCAGIYVQDKTIYFPKDMGVIQVWTATGQRIFHGRTTTVSVPKNGLYIVQTDCVRFKVLVR